MCGHKNFKEETNMKNLKKTLCLVLVIAMVCSLFVTTNAAFKYQADIDNATAAAVLNEIGVITGYTDGSFKPAGVLTRAEGATIIARLLLGDDAASYTAAGNPFDDVKATDWHAGYIAYCVAEGIVAGYGNGKFGPNDTLTVAQFGKMLLNALGYESAREGFTGADWATPVGKYINKLGLAEGANATLNASCTRQVAAQLALNTLKSTMVEYATGSTTIKGEGIEVTVGGSAAEKVENNAQTETLINDDYMQFAEQYFPLLRYNGSNNNNFGRPAVNAWSMRGVELGTEASEADLLKTYTGTVTRGALYDLLGKKVVNDLKAAGTASTVTVYVDGTAATSLNLDQIFNNDNDVKGDAVVFGSASYATGNGVVTEVYLEETATAYNVTIVVINTYVGVVAADYDEDAEELEIEVYGATGAGVAGTYTLSAEDYDVAGYEAEDFVLVTVDTGMAADEAIATIAPAKTVSGTVDTYTKSSSDWLNTITVGGKKYSYSKQQITIANGDASSVNAAWRGTDVTLVLDAAGYVISFAEADVVANYVYVTEIISETNFSSAKQSYLAAAYFTDGTYEELALAKVDGNTTITTGTGVAGWYTYSVNAEGKYILNTAANTTQTTSDIEGGKVAFISGQKANSKTVFVVVDEEGESTVFTGYKTMADVDCTGGNVVLDIITDEDTAYATFVFVTVDGGEISFSGSTKDTSTMVYIYRSGMFTENIDEEENVYYANTYALVNGVKTTINTEVDTWTTGLYIDVEYDNVTGYISGMTKVDGNNFTTDAVDNDGDSNDAFYLSTTLAAAAGDILFDGGVLDIDGYTYDVAEDIEIVLIEGTAYSKISMSKLTSLKNGTATFAGVVNAEGEVTALYVVYTKA